MGCHRIALRNRHPTNCFVRSIFLLHTATQDIPISWIILGFFACPMLVIHFQSIYLDLPAAVCIATGYFIFFEAMTTTKTFSWLWVICAAGALGLAGNIKYQSFIAVAIVSIVLIILWFTTSELSIRRFRIFVLTALIVADVIAAGTIIRNISFYDNPFYPLEIKIHNNVIFSGPESPETDAKYPTYRLLGNAPVPPPINFILSATEFDWILRGVAPWYNLDSSSGDDPRRSAPSWTGGWGALFVFFNGYVLLVQLIWFRKESDPQQRRLVISVLFLVLITACVPRAHELRYWLYIPLLVLPINLRYLARSPYRALVPGVLAAMTTYGIAEAVLSPNSTLLEPRVFSSEALRAKVPPSVARALRETGRYCAPGEYTLFRYSQAVTGVPGLLSGVAKDCPTEKLE